MLFCVQSQSSEKCAVPPVIKVKEDFMLDYTRLYLGSYDCNQNHCWRDIEVPGGCKCRSFSDLICRQLFHRLGSAVGLRKVLNL